jgi:hypothetical protein
VTRSNTLVLACAVLGAALLWPTDASAQRHAVRSGGSRSVVVGGGYFYRPWFYDPWYGWGYPYGWYPPPYAYGGRYVDSSLRLQVEPKETEVFIDGYYAGTVDDFDGFFQRLRLEPGEHEVQLYLAGHRTSRQKVYLQPTGTFRIRHTMQPLGPGEAPDPRPDPPANPPSQSGRYGSPGERARVDRPDLPERPVRDSAFGALAIRVQPEEAEVLVDGERWDGADGSDRLIIQLAEGEHRIEVRREGFSTYSSTIRVRRGETTALNISLVRE